MLAVDPISPISGGAIRVMDAKGKDVVFVETVGVGQDEVDIARLAHSTIVVAVSDLGDEIQAIKASILEVGDLFVFNKAEGKWTPPVIRAQALHNKGVDIVWQAIGNQQEYWQAGGARTWGNSTPIA